MLDEAHTVDAATAAENPDPGAGSVVFYGVVGVLAVIAIVFALEALFRTTADPEGTTKSGGPAAVALEQLHEQQREKLDGYGWIDREAGVARIPIERAMDLVVEEAGQ